jgi:hypothetical protein
MVDGTDNGAQRRIGRASLAFVALSTSEAAQDGDAENHNRQNEKSQTLDHSQPPQIAALLPSTTRNVT